MIDPVYVIAIVGLFVLAIFATAIIAKIFDYITRKW